MSTGNSRVDLTRVPLIRKWLVSRWAQYIIRVVALGGFLFTILAGFLGPVVGSHDFAIIMVWIAWWTALKLGFIPLGGRSWCSICPIPMPGEWLQNRGFFKSRHKGTLPTRQLPKLLRGKWLQAVGFLMVGLFGAVTLTSSRVTAIVLAGILVLALILSLIYERRSFCRYVCPIGGFTGLYAKAAPVEVRTLDINVCRQCIDKPCYQACSWGQYPPALQTSADCGLCMECLRVCPHENITVRLRQWGSEFQEKAKARLDETFLGLVMLSSVLVDTAVFLGPWGGLKTAAYSIGSREWLIYSALFMLVALVILPACFTLAVWFGARFKKTGQPLVRQIAHAGQVLIPLGLCAWIAFTISFAFAKFGYVLPVLSDPLGWGWHLLGPIRQAGVGQVSSISQTLQLVVLAAGLFWSANTVRRIYSSRSQALPLILFASIFTMIFMWLLIG